MLATRIAQDVTAATKGGKGGAGGYFPLTAAQSRQLWQCACASLCNHCSQQVPPTHHSHNTLSDQCRPEFDAADSSFENGVFFGPVAHLTFKGPCQLEGVGGCLMCINPRHLWTGLLRLTTLWRSLMLIGSVLQAC
jgi:hypothetical protein